MSFCCGTKDDRKKIIPPAKINPLRCYSDFPILLASSGPGGGGDAEEAGRVGETRAEPAPIPVPLGQHYPFKRRPAAAGGREAAVTAGAIACPPAFPPLPAGPSLAAR